MSFIAPPSLISVSILKQSQHFENCLTSDTGKLLGAQVPTGFLLWNTLLLMTTMGYDSGELYYLCGHWTSSYPQVQGKKILDDSPALIPKQDSCPSNYC